MIDEDDKITRKNISFFRIYRFDNAYFSSGTNIFHIFGHRKLGYFNTQAAEESGIAAPGVVEERLLGGFDIGSLCSGKKVPSFLLLKPVLLLQNTLTVPPKSWQNSKLAEIFLTILYIKSQTFPFPIK